MHPSSPVDGKGQNQIAALRSQKHRITCHVERSETSSSSNLQLEDPYSTALRTSSTLRSRKPAQDNKPFLDRCEEQMVLQLGFPFDRKVKHRLPRFTRYDGLNQEMQASINEIRHDG